MEFFSSVPSRWIIHLFIFLWMCLVQTYSESGVPLLESYTVSTFTQPPEETTSLNHFVVHERTGSVYVAADKYLYRLSSDFELLESNGTTKPSCYTNDLCHDFTKILAIASDDSTLIVCTSLDGKCETRNLTFISQLTESYVMTEVIVSGDSPDLTAVGVAVPVPGDTGANTPSHLYVANTLSFEVSSISNPIRQLDASNAFSNVGALNHLLLANGKYGVIYYEASFVHDGFVYFVMNQLDTGGVSMEGKLARVCIGANMDYYAEVPLSCSSANSPGTSYRVVQAANIGRAGEDVADSDVLLVAFSDTDSGSGNMALCTYSMEEVEAKFMQVSKDCLVGNASGAVGLSYLADSVCGGVTGVNDARIRQIVCSAGNAFYKYAGGLIDLSSTAALEFSSHTPTSIASAVDRHNTVVFVGTQEGALLKIHLMSKTSGRIYETLSLGSSPVLPDMYNDQDSSIVTATQEKLYRLSVARCDQFSTCGECIGENGGEDGDPYCGWCTLEARCTRFDECADAQMTDHWLPYDTNQCVSIHNVHPKNLRRDTHLPMDVRFTVAHLPLLSDDSAYSCRYGDIISETTSSIGTNVTCLSPAANQLPEIPPDRDHITVILSLLVDQSSVEVVSTEYKFYDCSRITSCSLCTDSSWGCDWCIEDNSCTHDSSSCMTVVSDEEGSSSCPRLLPLTSDIYIPVGLGKEFQLEVRDLPSSVASFECVLEVEDEEQVASAALISESIIKCQERQYTYTAGGLELVAAVRVRWNGVNYIDNVGNVNVTLYDCGFERDSCSLCLSPTLTPQVLGCGWCGQECGVRDSTPCQGDSWIPQGSNQSCPMPVLQRMSPSSGPVEGNTLVEIYGSDLGFSFSDISSVTLGAYPCNVDGLQNSYQVGARVSCVTSSASEAGEVDVAVAVRNQRNKILHSSGSVAFSYRNPVITGFSPSMGLANGGTLLTIEGSALQTGLNITASVQQAPCEIVSVSDDVVTCRTSAALEGSSGPVALGFDGALRMSAAVYSYMPNPTFSGLSPQKTIASGGINLTIQGVGFGYVQDALLIASRGTQTSSVTCYPNGDTELICPSPSLPDSQSTAEKRRRRRRRRSWRRTRSMRMRRDVEETSLTLSLDGYPLLVSETFEFYPDPTYASFTEEGRIKEVNGNDTLQIMGTDLNIAVTEDDIRVLIGDQSCKVLSIFANQLFCRLPLEQPAASNDADAPPYPAVTVLHGSILQFPLGYVRYKNEMTISIPLVITIAVLVGVAVVFTLVAVSFYGRRVHQHKLKSAEGALVTLEERLKDKATEAFHDLQRDMSGLKEQLQGVGMPFVSGADYIRNMLFWGLKVQPLAKDPEFPQESMKHAMAEFSKLLNKKEFLMDYIQGLDDAKTLQQKDRVNIASLLSVIMTTEGRFHYLTDVVLTLMEEKIEEADENRLKQLFRRTESILEKLIANGVALCMYKHLQNQVAHPLYVLYQAIKGQCEKGPVDAITGQAHFSLNFDYLLDEDVEYAEVTLQVVDKEHKVTEQVKVLDVDTITQAKQKILDAIYCKRQTAQQLRCNEVDLVLLNGQSGQRVLRDRDEITDVSSHWIRANTIKTYRISNGSSVAIIKKQDGSNTDYAGPLALDKAELAYTSLEEPTGNHHARASWEYTQIDMDPEEGKQMWHLVKDESHAVKIKKGHKIDHRPKLIKEVYISRSLVTKNAVQPFLNDFLVATFSLPEGQSSLPAHIKLLFDFFDKQADDHGNLKDNLAARWKNNSLPLRYWVTAISHPSFIFDMQQSRTADYGMNVLTNMLDHACKKNVPTYNLDAAMNRILYRPELPKYIKMVEEYYEAVTDLPEVSKAQLQKASQQITEEFGSHFSRMGMLYQLYEFTKEHTDTLDRISAIIKDRED